MFSEKHKAWLLELYPELVCSGDQIEGTARFRAAFNGNTNQFQIIYPNESNLIGGFELTGSFSVRIQSRSTGAVPRVPALTIDGFTHNEDRHISHDDTACLCSPFIENEYLTPELDGRGYIEELVIPFLYGQMYFDSHQSWPWADYAHGFMGLIESYTPVRAKEELVNRLPFLASYPAQWQSLRRFISQRKAPNASSPCICGSHRRIGRCHRLALDKILVMRRDRKKYRK